MCNLVTLKASVDEVAGAFRARRPQNSNASPGDVYPGWQGFVVCEDGSDRLIEAMTWGFPLRLKTMKPTSKPKPVNNARDDKLRSPMWRHWFETPAQRCLIPFTAFAEAEGEAGRMTGRGSARPISLSRHGPDCGVRATSGVIATQG